MGPTSRTSPRRPDLAYPSRKSPKRKSPMSAMTNVVPLPAVVSTQPHIETGKVGPSVRVTNRQRRSREHLMAAEVDLLMAAAGRLSRGNGANQVLEKSRDLPSASTSVSILPIA